MKNINLPVSKSYAQRYIIGGLLSCEDVVLEGVGDDFCDDIKAAIQCAKTLGAEIIDGENSIRIKGCGVHLQKKPINVKESGFCGRALSIVGMLCGGVEVKREGTLVARDLGVNEVLQQMRYEEGVLRGGEFVVEGGVSSQVLSGLLMTLPLACGDSVIRVKGLKSKPYVDMTLKVMEDFGVRVQRIGYEEFRIEGGQKYSGGKFVVERDWSAASYFIVLGFLRGEKYNFVGLNMDSLQADRAILDAVRLAEGGVAITFDATDCPDLVPSLVSLCSFLRGTSCIIGVERLRYKESSRADVLVREWFKFGVTIRLDFDIMYIEGVSVVLSGVVIDSCGDHRIAMAAGIMCNGVIVSDLGVVSKSFCNFFVILDFLLWGSS